PVLPADKKTVTHAIGPFCYLSIRFGHQPLLPVAIRGEVPGRAMRGGANFCSSWPPRLRANRYSLPLRCWTIMKVS
ncbi:hypothetical protein FJW08_13320, partial [Mesorhizobium sp. B3-2-1]